MKRMLKFISIFFAFLFFGFTFVFTPKPALAASCQYCPIANYELFEITPSNWNAACSSLDPRISIPTDNVNVCRYKLSGIPSTGYQCIPPQTNTSCQAGTAQCDTSTGCRSGQNPPPTVGDCHIGNFCEKADTQSDCPNANQLCTPKQAGTCDVDVASGTAGTCVLNTNSTCKSDSNCAQGYFCSNGSCTNCVPSGSACSDSRPCCTGAGTCGGSPAICGSISFNEVQPPCTNCYAQINTALGPIFTSPKEFVNWVLGFVLSIAGGILVVLIILAGYRLMTSQGDPEKIKEARERVTSALIGLFFIIFSFVIYQFITSSVLNLPGF